MESSSSNPSTITTEELDRFLDAPEEFYYDCSSFRFDSNRQSSSISGNPSAATLRRRMSEPRRNSIVSDVETEPEPSSSSSDSDGFKVVGESLYYVLKNDELKGDFEDDDVIESGKDLIDLSPEKENDSDAIDSIEERSKDTDASDSGQDRVDPFQETEESTVIDGEGDDHAVSESQLREPDSSTDSSLLGFVAGLVIKAIEFQVSMMISFLNFPPWLLKWCFLFFFDPFSMIKLGKRFLKTILVRISDMILGTMDPFKLSWFKDTKQMLNVACKFGWGLFWAVYVGIVLFGLLVLALMIGGFVINRIADKPFVVKEILNFDYTKNSPEAYVPITSCAGVSCDENCKESNEMWKIRGTRVIPRNHKLEVTLSMTLPESDYNKNLGMFQVRVDFLSADGQTIASIRRPCMLRFRSEPIRLVQTFFKVVPLVTGYVSEIQTLTLKLNGYVEKEIPTGCLKIMIEQRAEFRPGAGIPELYDASLSLQSDLPFFKKIIWKWRKTLFVWISMSLFVTELLLALVCCRPLIIPRTRGRDGPPSNPTRSR